MAKVIERVDNLSRGGWSISRADVAHYMLRVLEQPETIKQTIGIANKRTRYLIGGPHVHRLRRCHPPGHRR